MISRNWRGVAKTEESDNYVEHLTAETFPQLSKIDGFVSASILRRPTSKGVEYLIVTTWQSMDAIKQFAGDAPDLAVVPEQVQAMMVEYDREVAHYEVANTYRPE
jgi:heme-degrading monooxygenase HmoA